MSMYPPNPVLFVDDEEHFLKSCAVVLKACGINNLVLCSDSREVLPLLKKRLFDAILLDICMPNVTGDEILAEAVEEYPFIPVIMLTGNDDINTAVECMKQGAFDYILKPIDKDRLISSIKRAIEIRDLRFEVSMLKRHLLTGKMDNSEAFSNIIASNSNAMHAMFQYTESIAVTSWPVLITGETGVGKELLAEAIHRLSGRKGKFLAVNAAGLDDSVFSDMLFGHSKGAFTSADATRTGLIENASGGTLFLDEIGDLSHSSQIKLLRLLQNGEYYPLGTSEPKISSARIVVSTNWDVHSLQNKGKFRKDLYYRLSLHEITVPPLRDRPEDLPMLVEHFIEEASSSLGKKKPAYPKEMVSLLAAYSFPGNVRELKSLVFNAVSTHRKGILSLDTFRLHIGRERKEKIDRVPELGAPLLLLPTDRELPTLKEVENYLTDEAMKRANNNQRIASEILGLTRATLNKRLNRRKD